MSTTTARRRFAVDFLPCCLQLSSIWYTMVLHCQSRPFLIYTSLLRFAIARNGISATGGRFLAPRPPDKITERRTAEDDRQCRDDPQHAFAKFLKRSAVICSSRAKGFAVKIPLNERITSRLRVKTKGRNGQCFLRIALSNQGGGFLFRAAQISGYSLRNVGLEVVVIEDIVSVVEALGTE